MTAHECEDKPELPAVGVGSFSDQAEAENWIAEQQEAEAETAQLIDPSQLRSGDHVEVTYTGWVDDNGWIRSHATQACLLSPPKFDESGAVSVRVSRREEHDDRS